MPKIRTKKQPHRSTGYSALSLGRHLLIKKRHRILTSTFTALSISVILGACGTTTGHSSAKSKSTTTSADPPPSTTTTGLVSGSPIPGVPTSFAMVSWESLTYPDQAQCALPNPTVASPLAFDTTIEGAPYYFRGNGDQDFAVIPLRCTATNSPTGFVLLYQGTGTTTPKLTEVLVAGAAPVSSFGAPVETVAKTFSAQITPQGTFATFHNGSLLVCGGISGNSSGIGGPVYLSTFSFTQQGPVFALSSQTSASQPSWAGGPCPGE